MENYLNSKRMFGIIQLEYFREMREMEKIVKEILNIIKDCSVEEVKSIIKNIKEKNPLKEGE